MNYYAQTDEQAEALRKIRLGDEQKLSSDIMKALGSSIDKKIQDTQNEIKEVGAFLLKNRNSENEKIIIEMFVAEKKSVRLDEKFEELTTQRDKLTQSVGEFVGIAGDYKMAESMLDKITPLSNALANAVNNGYQPAEQLSRFVSYEVQRYKDIQSRFINACKANPEMAKASGIPKVEG